MELLLPLVMLALVHTVAVISPGPTLVLVAQTAAGKSRATATAAAGGIAFGTFVWATSALFGLDLLFQVAPWLYLTIKIAGGVFLLYLAYKLWSSASQPLALAATDDAQAQDDGWRAARTGLWVQLSNPKVAVFFGSIFVAVLPTDRSLVLSAAAIALVTLIEFSWYALMAAAFAQSRVASAYGRAKSVVDRACAGVLGALGVGVLATR
ncbi:MAG: LysE family transporter [Pseudomonadota bacterium]